VRAPQAPGVAVAARRWPVAAVVAIVVLLQAVVIVTHQLTPYVVLFATGLLTVFGFVRLRWLVLALGAMTVAYLAINYEYVDENFGVFSSFDPFRNVKSSGLYDITPLAGKELQGRVGTALSLALWGLTAVAALRLARRGLTRQALPVALFAVAPFAIVLGQNYGGEAVLRVFLLSAPWCAALIGWAILTVAGPARRTLLLLAVAGAFAALFVPAFFGQANIHLVPPGAVAASEHFYANARPNSVLMLSGPNFPVRFGERYDEFRGPQSDDDPNLLRTNRFRYRALGSSRDVVDVIALIQQYARTGYVVFSAPQEEYARTYQLTPPGALRDLERAIARDPRFALWYRNGDARIYEYAGGRAP